MDWTEPHYGVSHLLGIQDGYQITIEHHGDWAETYLLCLRSLSPFSPTRIFVGAPEAATHTAEEWGLALIDEHAKESK